MVQKRERGRFRIYFRGRNKKIRCGTERKARMKDNSILLLKVPGLRLQCHFLRIGPWRGRVGGELVY